MEHDGIMLSETSERKKNNCDLLYMWDLKKQTDRNKEQICQQVQTFIYKIIYGDIRHSQKKG